MKILVALAVNHPHFNSIDEAIEGKIACSGSNGSAIRLANAFHKAGIQVYLSAESKTISTKFPCLLHTSVNPQEFDYLIAHHTHWDGLCLTFGSEAISKTLLWVKNPICASKIHTFIKEGGKQIICPSFYHVNLYRAIPQWNKKLSVIPNIYCSVFTPSTSVESNSKPTNKPRLIFAGALRASKGLVELTKIWSYLAQKKANLDLAIAGGISIHSNKDVGSMGLAEKDVEDNLLKPWLKFLPKDYQPIFLGALTPLQLRDEFYNSWAAIVNPGAIAETFCVAAVDAQACGLSVFSIEYGGLTETVYREKFDTLAKDTSIKSIGDRILDGLSNMESVAENSRSASQFVKDRFDPEKICSAWLELMADNEQNLSSSWHTSRDVACDFMRWTGTGLMVHQLAGAAKAENRRVMKNYRSYKKSQLNNNFSLNERN